MLNWKKLLAVVISVVLCMSMWCVGTLAADDIPDDLPEGTIKIADGIYAYTPSVPTRNSLYWTNIGTVPGFGTIAQPTAVNNIVAASNDTYLHVACKEVIRINLVSGTQSVFGSNLFDWPAIGGSSETIYYIHLDSFNIARNVSYQLQCTSQISDALRNVEFRYYTNPYKTEIY